MLKLRLFSVLLGAMLKWTLMQGAWKCYSFQSTISRKLGSLEFEGDRSRRKDLLQRLLLRQGRPSSSHSLGRRRGRTARRTWKRRRPTSSRWARPWRRASGCAAWTPRRPARRTAPHRRGRKKRGCSGWEEEVKLLREVTYNLSYMLQNLRTTSNTVHIT